MRGRRLLWVRQVRRFDGFDRYGFAVSAGSPVLLISISRAPVEPGNLSNRTCRTYRTSEPAEPANTVIAFMIKHVAPFRSDGTLNVIVETPRGSTAKFKYDSASDLIMLSRPLPAGLAYPHDWGFVPGTRAPDGDPLDVMVVWDGSAYPGVLIACRPIGVLRVEQTNRGTGARERNDRLLAVPVGAARGRDLRHVHDLPERTLEELEHFFQAVVAFEGKELALLRWGDRDAAAEAVEAATER